MFQHVSIKGGPVRSLLNQNQSHSQKSCKLEYQNDILGRLCIFWGGGWYPESGKFRNIEGWSDILSQVASTSQLVDLSARESTSGWGLLVGLGENWQTQEHYMSF